MCLQGRCVGVDDRVSVLTWEDCCPLYSFWVLMGRACFNVCFHAFFAVYQLRLCCHMQPQTKCTACAGLQPPLAVLPCMPTLLSVSHAIISQCQLQAAWQQAEAAMQVEPVELCCNN